jgi:hypothetical protein
MKGKVMKPILAFILAVSLLGIAGGCASDQQVLNDEQNRAVTAAARRGQFEMSCPSATATILSSNLLQPAAWRGVERAEYTVGVEGCGKKSTYVVVCQIGSVDCVAVSGQNRVFGQS